MRTLENVDDDIIITSMAGIRQEINNRQLFITYHLQQARKLLHQSVQLKNCLNDMEKIRRKKIASNYL